jgi:hypothetical protein
MVRAANFEAWLDEICAAFGPFALGRRAEKLRVRILEIRRWLVFNSEAVIPLARRRKIAADARKLLTSLDGLGGLDDGFIGTLRALALGAPDRQGHGGDRRSDQRTVNGSVLGMAVRLHIEAHAKPGFAANGPLVRFVNNVRQLLDIAEPFTPDSIKAEYNAMRKKVSKPLGPRFLYEK